MDEIRVLSKVGVLFHHRRVKKYFSVPGEVVELALSTPTAGEM